MSYIFSAVDTVALYLHRHLVGVSSWQLLEHVFFSLCNHPDEVICKNEKKKLNAIRKVNMEYSDDLNVC